MERRLDGLVVLDKPAGISSHAAVSRVRKRLGVRRAGHAGTLDPLATGVLLVGINRGTRLLEYLVGHDKTYRAQIRLGLETDTLDREGQVVAREEVPALDTATLHRVAADFEGSSEQVPPRFSAIKVGGEPLYRKARRGEEVAVPKRTVTIRRLEVLSWAPPDLTLEVECSKGTYVRSLARDFGTRLGTVASLWGLVRTASGDYKLAQAATLEQLEGAEPPVLPLEAMARELPRVDLSAAAAARLCHGHRVPDPGADAATLAVFHPDGHLLAVARREAGELVPSKVFTAA